MLRIAVMGLGNFGYFFARHLSRQRVEILALDIDKAAVDRAGAFVTEAIVGDVTDRSLLEELEIGSVDYAVISLGDEHMDPSVLATLHARALGVPNIYVKAVSDDHAQILDLIGATKVIHPEREVAESLAETLGKPNVLDFIPLGEDYSIIEFEPSSVLVGRTLADVDFRNRYGITVIGIKEYLTSTRRMNPPAETVIGDDVSLLILGRMDQIEKLQKDAGR
ncbi:MAG TPA: TrkA family potassium uptake protein [Gemmatimonadota bacterium]|nr:TrkA family potassium uptake protein [Gemmatimonadota bacterium]